ncbi:MAG: sigma-70 family RNA polymerase sigma factor [Bacteroidales bacterium]|nr:sigma-70 family RNA polymerase sigma factor [Bacteroidales bacterium]
MNREEHPFIKITTQHTALIDKICRSFCGDNIEDNEDLRQDIILNLWRGWRHWKPYHKPITWIYRVAMNTAISWRRNRLRQIETQPIVYCDIPQDNNNNEEIEQLYALIRQLPAGDQRLLQLYIDGWSGAEIAKMMQISESNVTTRIARIKGKLKELNSKL